jgi:YfiR/HmsC-like
MALLTMTRAVLALLFTASVCSPFGQISQSAPEHEVKAAFLFNFTKFVNWPAIPAAQPFRVCVLADEATTAAIDRAMQNERILDRKTETIVPASLEQARSCQVLFIGRDGSSRGASILPALRSLPVLTVGDGPDFLERGGIIQFVTAEGKIRFDVSLTNAARAQLSINARMLRVAREVKGTP